MKIDIVRYLLDEIENEQDRQKRYETEKSRAWKEAERTGKRFWECEKWSEPYPHKTRISENCKVARRMLLEIAKEAHDGQTV